MDWTLGPADSWDQMGNWLRGLSADLGSRPKAVLLVSAHWEEDEFQVSAADPPRLIYDYYGFPDHTYRLEYPASGAPELAAEVRNLLEKAGIPCMIHPKRGLDHGAFIPLKLIFPEASTPVASFSLKSSLDPRQHLDAGKALAPLRRKGVWIVGSGMSYHNMSGLMSPTTEGVIKPSEPFDTWLTMVCGMEEEPRARKLRQWAEAPSARECHPREEHLLPLMVVAGAAESSPGRKIFSDVVMGARISAFQF